MGRDVFGERSSGVLLHVTSLPGPFGSGDLGPDAHRFIDFLASAGQRFWQMLPVSPPGAGDSPYDSASAFAGSPYLVSLELLAQDGLLEPGELAVSRRLTAGASALYPASRRCRGRRLRSAFSRFKARPGAGGLLARFSEENADWLADYALFRALHRAHGPLPWPRWDPTLVRREPGAMERARSELADEIALEVFV